MRDDDAAHLLVLEGVVVAAIVLGAVLYVLAAGQEHAAPTSSRDDLRRVSDDAVRILAGIPIDDEKYGDRYLNKAIADSLSGDTVDLDGKLTKLLPAASSFNVYLDNGVGTRQVIQNRAPPGERVASGTAFAPDWSVAHAITDFKIHPADVTKSMKLTVFPVHHGRLLPDDPLVANTDFEADADADGVPDAWAVDGGATGTLVDDAGDTVWELVRATDGRAAYASNAFRADAGTGVAVDLRAKGDAACVQVRFYDEAMNEVSVGGSPTACVATIPVSVVWTDVGGTHVVGNDPDVAFVRVEIALTDLSGGTVTVDDVVVRPLVVATMDDASTVHVERVGASKYETTTTAYDRTGTSVDLELRYRRESVEATLAYEVDASPLLLSTWDDARTGLTNSILTVSDDAVSVGETIDITFDFTQYEDTLAGVTLVDPQVVVRIYEPVLGPDSAPLLLASRSFTVGQIAGTWTYTHPDTALYGTHLVVASLEHGGLDTLDDQVARKAVTFDSRLRDGSVANPPVYRVVLETWFPEWR